MASRIGTRGERWGRGEEKHDVTLFIEEGKSANKNAGKKGARGRHYALLAGPLIMAVSFSAPTLTLIQPNEHRARNICIIAAILTPFDAECIWSRLFGLFLPPRAPPDLRFQL